MSTDSYDSDSDSNDTRDAKIQNISTKICNSAIRYWDAIWRDLRHRSVAMEITMTELNQSIIDAQFSTPYEKVYALLTNADTYGYLPLVHYTLKEVLRLRYTSCLPSINLKIEPLHLSPMEKALKDDSWDDYRNLAKKGCTIDLERVLKIRNSTLPYWIYHSMKGSEEILTWEGAFIRNCIIPGQKYNILHFAACGHNIKVLSHLLKHFDISGGRGRNICGSTPLHWAVITDSLEAVKMIVRRARDWVSLKNGASMYPLHWAVCRKNLDIVKALLGANWNLWTNSSAGIGSPKKWAEDLELDEILTDVESYLKKLEDKENEFQIAQITTMNDVEDEFEEMWDEDLTATFNKYCDGLNLGVILRSNLSKPSEEFLLGMFVGIFGSDLVQVVIDRPWFNAFKNKKGYLPKHINQVKTIKEAKEMFKSPNLNSSGSESDDELFLIVYPPSINSSSVNISSHNDFHFTKLGMKEIVFEVSRHTKIDVAFEDIKKARFICLAYDSANPLSDFCLGFVCGTVGPDRVVVFNVGRRRIPSYFSNQLKCFNKGDEFSWEVLARFMSAAQGQSFEIEDIFDDLAKDAEIFSTIKVIISRLWYIASLAYGETDPEGSGPNYHIFNACVCKAVRAISSCMKLKKEGLLFASEYSGFWNNDPDDLFLLHLLDNRCMLPEVDKICLVIHVYGDETFSRFRMVLQMLKNSHRRCSVFCVTNNLYLDRVKQTMSWMTAKNLDPKAVLMTDYNEASEFSVLQFSVVIFKEKTFPFLYGWLFEERVDVEERFFSGKDNISCGIIQGFSFGNLPESFVDDLESCLEDLKKKKEVKASLFSFFDDFFIRVQREDISLSDSFEDLKLKIQTLGESWECSEVNISNRINIVDVIIEGISKLFPLIHEYKRNIVLHLLDSYKKDLIYITEQKEFLIPLWESDNGFPIPKPKFMYRAICTKGDMWFSRSDISSSDFDAIYNIMFSNPNVRQQRNLVGTSKLLESSREIIEERINTKDMAKFTKVLEVKNDIPNLNDLYNWFLIDDCITGKSCSASFVNLSKTRKVDPRTRLHMIRIEAKPERVLMRKRAQLILESQSTPIDSYLEYPESIGAKILSFVRRIPWGLTGHFPYEVVTRSINDTTELERPNRSDSEEVLDENEFPSQHKKYNSFFGGVKKSYSNYSYYGGKENAIFNSVWMLLLVVYACRSLHSYYYLPWFDILGILICWIGMHAYCNDELCTKYSFNRVSYRSISVAFIIISIISYPRANTYLDGTLRDHVLAFIVWSPVVCPFYHYFVEREHTHKKYLKELNKRWSSGVKYLLCASILMLGAYGYSCWDPPEEFNKFVDANYNTLSDPSSWNEFPSTMLNLLNTTNLHCLVDQEKLGRLLKKAPIAEGKHIYVNHFESLFSMEDIAGVVNLPKAVKLIFSEKSVKEIVNCVGEHPVLSILHISTLHVLSYFQILLSFLLICLWILFCILSVYGVELYHNFAMTRYNRWKFNLELGYWNYYFIYHVGIIFLLLFLSVGYWKNESYFSYSYEDKRLHLFIAWLSCLLSFVFYTLWVTWNPMNETRFDIEGSDYPSTEEIQLLKRAQLELTIHEAELLKKLKEGPININNLANVFTLRLYQPKRARKILEKIPDEPSFVYLFVRWQLRMFLTNDGKMITSEQLVAASPPPVKRLVQLFAGLRHMEMGELQRAEGYFEDVIGENSSIYQQDVFAIRAKINLLSCNLLSGGNDARTILENIVNYRQHILSRYKASVLYWEVLSIYYKWGTTSEDSLVWRNAEKMKRELIHHWQSINKTNNSFLTCYPHLHKAGINIGPPHPDKEFLENVQLCRYRRIPYWIFHVITNLFYVIITCYIQLIDENGLLVDENGPNFSSFNVYVSRWCVRALSWLYLLPAFSSIDLPKSYNMKRVNDQYIWRMGAILLQYVLWILTIFISNEYRWYDEGKNVSMLWRSILEAINMSTSLFMGMLVAFRIGVIMTEYSGLCELVRRHKELAEDSTKKLFCRWEISLTKTLALLLIFLPCGLHVIRGQSMAFNFPPVYDFAYHWLIMAILSTVSFFLSLRENVWCVVFGILCQVYVLLMSLDILPQLPGSFLQIVDLARSVIIAFALLKYGDKKSLEGETRGLFYDIVAVAICTGIISLEYYMLW